MHHYQQDSNAIAIQRQKTGITNTSARKSFTTLLGKLLLDRGRHLSIKQLMAIGKLAIQDIQSHDLQIYFTNPAAEGWLVEHGYSGAMDSFTKQDGFMVVQANISISKASQYVHTTEQDNITLDAHGGATHILTITLDYEQKGPVYGYDTYADYIRVYAPPDAQFLSGDGFDTGQSLCTPANSPIDSPGIQPAGCAQYNTFFPGEARYCPNGDYSLGYKGYLLGAGFTSWPIDSLGPPTALTSDLAGRAMWGGLTETPKNCISYITLSWYVPNVVKHVSGHSPYVLLVQKQGGYVPTVQVAIDPSALNIRSLKPYQFNGDLTADRVFALPVSK